jgi:hypothetical protein
MREIRRFELDADLCIARRVTSACELAVETGRIWLTIEGDACDHWLSAGERFMLPRGKHIWLSAETGGARLRVVESGGAPPSRLQLGSRAVFRRLRARTIMGASQLLRIRS